MKTYIALIILICSNVATAQKMLDTIYANDTKNVALFFPKPIRQGITGTENFVFNYNREKEQYFALLQAKPGMVSNLLTVTNDGQVYSYILKYSETLPKLNYFISENESIGNEQPIILPVEPKTTHDQNADRNTHFKKLSGYLLKSRHDTPKATMRKKGIKLQLQKMVYNANEVYFVIEIANRSGIDFEIDFLNIYRTNGNNKKKASYQRLEQKVVQRFNMPGIVKDKQSQRLVYVLPKLVLGDNEKLEVELKELKGSRKVILRTSL